MDGLKCSCLLVSLWLVAGCGAGAAFDSGDPSELPDDDGAGGSNGSPGFCSGGCAAGFHCEFDECVPDSPPEAPMGEGRSPLSSGRYVFSLERQLRRLIRIDSSSLQVDAFAAGLAPMTLQVVGERELSILLDAFNLVEILDHRQSPPQSAAWSTARSLSHIAPSPTGEHAILYYDWDDPRAQERQPEPGNINQVSILFTGDSDTPFTDDDPRITHVAVGFLPRDVRFSQDGHRAVVIGRSTLTPIDLASPFVTGDWAAPQSDITFDHAAAEILIDGEGTLAALRYQNSGEVQVLNLDSGALTCLGAAAPVTDIALTRDNQLVILSGEDGTSSLAVVDLLDAAEPCTAVPPGIALTDADRIALDSHSDLAIAYVRDLDIERIWKIDLDTQEATSISLEKAVDAVAFAGDGRFAMISHLVRDGTPAWNPAVEDPEVSVDKAYGVSWIDLLEGRHRLAVSDHPFGHFAFVPPSGGNLGATFIASLDPAEPHLLRVQHSPGFADRRVALAAMPQNVGFLAATERSYALQEHPWGRVTFTDVGGLNLRHVTGFALEVRP